MCFLAAEPVPMEILYQQNQGKMARYHDDCSYSTDAVCMRGIIPVILQSLRPMLHPTASHYNTPEILMFPYELILAALQSS